MTTRLTPEQQAAERVLIEKLQKTERDTLMRKLQDDDGDVDQTLFNLTRAALKDDEQAWRECMVVINSRAKSAD